jgi:hypothetical protein
LRQELVAAGTGKLGDEPLGSQLGEIVAERRKRIALRGASERLDDVLGRLWAIFAAVPRTNCFARELEKPKPKKVTRAALDAPHPVVWSLALDEIQATGVDVRPRLPFNGPRDFTGPKRVSLRAAAAPLSTILQPIALDPLTVADDPNFLSEIANQPNVPDSVRTGLVLLY